jgi:predicted PurR-regulated permease PerM
MVKFLDWIDTQFCILKVRVRKSSNLIFRSVLVITLVIIVGSIAYTNSAPITSFINQYTSFKDGDERITKLESNIEILLKSNEEKSIRIKDLEQQIQALTSITETKEKQIKKLASNKKPLIKKEFLLDDQNLVKVSRDILGLDIKIR